MDYYGKRLATCSSDRTVKVFDVVDGETQRSGGHTLKGCVLIRRDTGGLRFSYAPQDTQVQCGKFPGQIPSLGTSSPLVLMTEK